VVDEWKGPNPFYLTIQTAEGNTVIDLDETGWLTTYAHLLREPGAWMLSHKAVLQAVAIILVQEGEQPYYTARHVGIAFGGSGEMIAYGIGKKRLDGHVDRIWVLPNGVICTGDDVEPLVLAFIRAGGAQGGEAQEEG
jgi:hypothetical protein